MQTTDSTAANTANANTDDANATLIAKYDNQIAELNAKIYMLCCQNQQQQAYINSHARKIGRIHQVIYQMCGKLFDHESEMDYVCNYMNYMQYNNHASHIIEDRDFDDSDDNISESESESESKSESKSESESVSESEYEYDSESDNYIPIIPY